ncbi:MAG TPA: thiamine pyrophosphate-dependent dehydrogenase E1 component subunit alpha [Micromonosporaceae bacterium]|jgi:pyruvate dehydrogenase E1 component alpha subunit
MTDDLHVPSTAAQRRAAVADPIEQLRRMVEIRLLEDALNRLYSDGMIRGSIHTCQGQEAVAVAAAACSRPEDFVCATYRGHGVAMAFGVTPLAVAAEVLGRVDGSTGGLGGSMHLVDASVNVLPTMAIVGAGMPIAAGAALAASVTRSGAVSFCLFGDGSTNIGAFHEALNLAAVWRLPVVFICENNLYGEYSPLGRTTAVDSIAERGRAYSMHSLVADGQDLAAMREAVGQAAGRARAGEGPTLIEAKTYRYHGHSRADPATYRPEGELEAWLRRDPVTLYAEALRRDGALDEPSAQRLRESVELDVNEAVARAISSARPGQLSQLMAHVSGRDEDATVDVGRPAEGAA